MALNRNSIILPGEEIDIRRDEPEESVQQVMFRVTALYGLSRESIRLPLSKRDSIESGQICLTIDPDADPASNIGFIDYRQGLLKVTYNAQWVSPGLFQLITEGKHDPSLLNPVRVTATDECTLEPDLSGWHALGCLDFLPGSIWAGAAGG